MKTGRAVNKAKQSGNLGKLPMYSQVVEASPDQMKSAVVKRFASEVRATRHTVSSASIVDGNTIVIYKEHPQIARQMMVVFKKYWLQPQTQESTVELVETYIRLYPDVAAQDEFLKGDVLPVLPEKLKGRDLVQIPTASELQKKGAIPRRLAAAYLRCTGRTIGNYLAGSKLNRTPEGLVSCDDKLNRILRQKYGAAFRLK